MYLISKSCWDLVVRYWGAMRSAHGALLAARRVQVVLGRNLVSRFARVLSPVAHRNVGSEAPKAGPKLNDRAMRQIGDE